MRTQRGLGSAVDDPLAGVRDVLPPREDDDELQDDDVRRRPWTQLLIAVIAALLAIYLAGQTAARMWLEDLDARLLDAGAGANAAAIVLEREHLEAYRAIAYSDGFAADLAALDVLAIEERIQPVDANHAIPMIDIIDDQNRVVFAFRAAGAVRPVYRERRSVEIVRQALAGERDDYGERFTALIATDEGPLIATAGPVRSDGEIVGAVLLMTPLDELLSLGRNLHGSHLTAYSLERGDPLATTTPIRPRTLETGLRATLAHPEELPYATRFRVGGNPHREQIAALTIRHRPAALLGAALPDRSRQVAWNVMTIVALGMAIMAALIISVAYAWFHDRRVDVPPPREPAALPPAPEDRRPTGATRR